MAMDWGTWFDSVDQSLKGITTQLRTKAGSSSSELPSVSSFSLGKEQLLDAIVFHAFLFLGLLPNWEVVVEDIDHHYQELLLLSLSMDLSKELQILSQMEHVITLILHLASINVPARDIIDTLNQEVPQGSAAIVLFPYPEELSAYNLAADMDIIHLLAVSLYYTTLQDASVRSAYALLSKFVGHSVAKAEGGKSRFSPNPALKELKEYNMAAEKSKGDRLRAEFLKEANLKPPPVMRVIDCQSTCREKRVVLRDWKDCAQGVGFSAISHTYGQEVYKVFNCRCATICKAEKLRCSSEPCPHDPGAPDATATATQNRVMGDILKMCAILREAGVDYVWHDGVCIAQHDEVEVEDTIKHIGWVYSNARETIIFLHYVGKPIAPISSDHNVESRWHRRAWTYQEAALSRCRRYCVRVGTSLLGICDSFEEFERKLALWYSDDFSRIEVIEEERFFEILRSTKTSLALSLESRLYSVGHLLPEELSKYCGWSFYLNELIDTLQSVCFSFPTIDDAMQECAKRDSKHKGDRINSILALARVKGFVAPKDKDVEASTIKFFARQGQTGLAKAVFSTPFALRHVYRDRQERTGFHAGDEVRSHTWLPSLQTKFYFGYKEGIEHKMRFEVMEDGNLRVRAGMLCIKVRLALKVKAPSPLSLLQGGDVVIDGREGKPATAASHDGTYVPLDLVSRGSSDYADALLSEGPAHCRRSAGVMVSSFFSAAGKLLQGDKHFDAHLVIVDHWFDHALVVQGDLRHPVSKIGLLRPADSFLDDIRKLRSIGCKLPVTALHELIII